jgi:hypothetical protein
VPCLCTFRRTAYQTAIIVYTPRYIYGPRGGVQGGADEGQGWGSALSWEEDPPSGTLYHCFRLVVLYTDTLPLISASFSDPFRFPLHFRTPLLIFSFFVSERTVLYSFYLSTSDHRLRAAKIFQLGGGSGSRAPAFLTHPSPPGDPTAAASDRPMILQHLHKIRRLSTLSGDIAAQRRIR